MTTDLMNKQTLRAIIDNEFALPAGADEYEAVKQVVGVLGSTDPELRDEYGYTVLHKWLTDKNFLTHEQLKQLLDDAISQEKLFFGIGNRESDTVFLRTFSALLIALILRRDNREEFLDEIYVRKVMNSLVSYCQQEKDLRGYVDTKGWAHAAAHISDAIDECVCNRYMGLEDCKLTWSGLLSLIENAPFVYGAEEDERIATAVTSMVESGKVSFPVLCAWVMEIEVPKRYELRTFYRRINYKNLIRSLFIRLRHKGLLLDERQLFAVEQRFNRYAN